MFSIPQNFSLSYFISFLLQIFKYCFSPSFFVYIVYRFCSFAFDVLKVLIEETISMSHTD